MPERRKIRKTDFDRCKLKEIGLISWRARRRSFFRPGGAIFYLQALSRVGGRVKGNFSAAAGVKIEFRRTGAE